MAYDHDIYPIVDAIAALVSVPSGFVRNDALALPQEYAPNTLYAAPLNQQSEQVETGFGEKVWFRMRLAYSVSSRGEDGGKLRLRAVSLAEGVGVTAIYAAIIANRSTDLWGSVEVDRAQYDAVAQQECRVAWVDLLGWRLVLRDVG